MKILQDFYRIYKNRIRKTKNNNIYTIIMGIREIIMQTVITMRELEKKIKINCR